MIASRRDRFAAGIQSAHSLHDVKGASLAEFAISLPLLVVLVVGIFDFGGAFNLKQEINNAAREAARFGASQPTNDLCNDCIAPNSVDAIRVFVDNYLQAATHNDCGLSGASPPTGSNLTWTYTAGSCPASLTLTIVRGFAASPAGCTLTASPYGNVPTVYIPCTQVMISYPYEWHFNSVIQLIVPGSTFALSNITTTSTAANMN
jgi:Flp pilus assembly protein TadG